MKKQILEFLLVIFIGGIAGGIIGSKINERANYREFEFRGGYSYCGGGYERSLSHVLVNEKNYDVANRDGAIKNRAIQKGCPKYYL